MYFPRQYFKRESKIIHHLPYPRNRHKISPLFNISNKIVAINPPVSNPSLTNFSSHPWPQICPYLDLENPMSVSPERRNNKPLHLEIYHPPGKKKAATNAPPPPKQVCQQRTSRLLRDGNLDGIIELRGWGCEKSKPNRQNERNHFDRAKKKIGKKNYHISPNLTP